MLARARAHTHTHTSTHAIEYVSHGGRSVYDFEGSVGTGTREVCTGQATEVWICIWRLGTVKPRSSVTSPERRVRTVRTQSTPNSFIYARVEL